MAEIVIGDKAKSILSSFSSISPTLRVREDYIYAKSESISGIYTLPAGEIKVDNPFVLFDADDFLGVLGMFNDPKLDKDGMLLTIKDSTKKAKYLASEDSMAPVRNMTGEELFAASQDIAFTCILNEQNLKEIESAVKVIHADEMTIVCKDGGVMASVRCQATENSIEIALDGTSTADMEISLSNKSAKATSILGSLFTGIYGLQCRKALIKGPGGDSANMQEIWLAKFINQSVTDGQLYYFASVAKL